MYDDHMAKLDAQMRKPLHPHINQNSKKIADAKRRNTGGTSVHDRLHQ